MTFSSLATGTLPHHGKWSYRPETAITRVIAHHWGGTSGGDTRLTDPAEKVSANYIIFGDGRLVGQVPEEHRAWTTGSMAVDRSAITIEIQDETGAPEWKISDQAINTLTALLVDVARRRGWPDIGPERLAGHRDFMQTACPGPYLYARLGQIAAAADTAIHGGQPTQKEEDEMNPTQEAILLDVRNKVSVPGQGYGAPMAALNLLLEMKATLAAHGAILTQLAATKGIDTTAMTTAMTAAIDQSVKTALSGLEITLTNEGGK